MIRLAKLTDAAQLNKIYQYYIENTSITFEYDVISDEEFQNRMKKIMEKYPYLVYEQDGIVLGYAYANSFKNRKAYDWSVETTIYLDVNAKGKGIGRQLYEALEYCLKKQNILNMNACISYTEHENEHLDNTSMYFHEKMGFQLVGTFHKCGYKFNEWVDMIWMEKFIGEHKNNMEEVIPFVNIKLVK
ncbi:GNAT family N-acetyltransferase [Floccifex sp.]|uniref:GNAT family N-acetyltransferase n=1 Tax=Floccifex sp. TaxID=2815810 RepID=UPI002A7597E8|nr:N-acetyltransferase family protein [Floccifex sp.]MDD7281566.1 GNAT family N-acetyltransferase [Erysipelotrichaceae bacterium]MDY2958456.1 N-acetyltransferase family protein [Floccifex sp.]